MNAFASYGDENARGKTAKPLSALELKMREKQRLTRAYKASLSRDRRQAFEDEPRLRDFMRWLRRQDEPVELVTGISESWLPQAARNVRLFALRLIDRHCDRLNRQMGNEALDDPLPPETNVFFQCRDILHRGGMA